MILTHPARWAGRRLHALAMAAHSAGIDNVRFVPEPVAAAMHVAEGLVAEGGYLAVYDLGGGTFDTAILQHTGDGYQIIGAPGGNDRFGGENLDELLYHHVGRTIAEHAPDAWESLRFGTERPWRKANHDLRVEVQRAKEALSSTADYTIYIGAPLDQEVHVTRSELETLIFEPIAATVDELSATFEHAGLEVSQLAAVALVGGSSRIPLIARLVSDRLGTVPSTWGDPKASVVLGALTAEHLSVVPPTSTDVSRPPRAARFRGPVPERIGPYEVVTQLGQGGMGVVYLAHQPSLDRLVAVKTLPALGRSFTDRLRREEPRCSRSCNTRTSRLLSTSARRPAARTWSCRGSRAEASRTSSAAAHQVDRGRDERRHRVCRRSVGRNPSRRLPPPRRQAVEHPAVGRR